MVDNKYGFVYIWFDRKHKRYYIGSHWGTEDDGYICSSSWMKRAYNLRPNDFKRRILSRIYSNRNGLLDLEYRWLILIKPDELKTKYYNLKNYRISGWWADIDRSKTTAEKISAALTGKKLSDDHCKKIGLSKLGNKNRLGKIHSEESKQKMRKPKSNSENMGRKADYTQSDEIKSRISESLIGIERSVETRNKMRKSHNPNSNKIGRGPYKKRVKKEA